MDVPGLHQHKVYGLVCSQVPWKLITQNKKSPKYQRNLSLLNIAPANKTIKPRPACKNPNFFTVYKKKNFQNTSQASSYYKPLKPRYSVSSSNSSIDVYKQMGMRNIRNYIDSEDDDDAHSKSSNINSSFRKQKNDLALIDESRYTHPSSLNLSVVIKHPPTNKSKEPRAMLKRQTYSLSKQELKFSLV